MQSHGALLGWAAKTAVLLLFDPADATVLPWDAANVPSAAWPAATEEESNNAWPAGAQPPGLVAWPKDLRDHPAPCWNVSVLEDTAHGWAGQCVGLSRDRAADNSTKCEVACRGDPECPVWQWNDQTHCWRGSGRECDVRDANDHVNVSSGQRLQHGIVRVLANLQGWQVHGMRHLGLWATGGVAEGLTHCQNWCYSDVNCQYWQYGNDGCWVEDPGYSMFSDVQYPLTTSGGASSDTDWAKTSVGGEFIQHICPVRPDPSAEAPVSAGGWSFLPQAPWRAGAPTNAWVPWLSVLALLFVGGCLGCTLLGRGHDGGSRPQRTKRAAKPSARSSRSGRSEGNSTEGELAPLMAPPSSETPGDSFPQVQIQLALPQMQPVPQAFQNVQLSHVPQQGVLQGPSGSRQDAPGNLHGAFHGAGSRSPRLAPAAAPGTSSGISHLGSFQPILGGSLGHNPYARSAHSSPSPAGSFPSQYASPARP